MNHIGKTLIKSLPYKVTFNGSVEIHQYHQYFFSRLNAPSPWHPDHAALNPFPKKALGGECWCSALGALLATPLSPYHSWAFTFLFLISQLLCCLIMSLWLSGTLRHLLLQINFCHQINSFVARVYPYLSRSTSSQCQPDGIFWNLILLSREMSANMFSSSQRQWLCVCVCVCVCVYTQSCPSLWDPIDYSPQAPRSMGFSRQEHWHGLPFPPPGDLPNPGIKLMSPVSPALAGGFFTIQPPRKAMLLHRLCHFHQDLCSRQFSSVLPRVLDWCVLPRAKQSGTLTFFFNDIFFFFFHAPCGMQNFPDQQ